MLTSNDGNQYSDWVDYHAQLHGLNSPEEEKNSYHKENNPEVPVDREHHVPLVASAIMDEEGNMSGLAIDHRVQVPKEYIQHLALHEGTELPLMHSYMEADGMKPGDAYAKAHATATAVESASVKLDAVRRGIDPESYLEQYKQHWRDAAAISREPTDRERHPDAHTTRFALDEHELGHKPLQIDVMGGGTTMHSGPMVSRPANENVPHPESMHDIKYETAVMKQHNDKLQKEMDKPWVITPQEQPGLKATIIYPKDPNRAEKIFEQDARQKAAVEQRRQQLRDYAKERAGKRGEDNEP